MDLDSDRERSFFMLAQCSKILKNEVRIEDISGATLSVALSFVPIAMGKGKEERGRKGRSSCLPEVPLE